MTAITTIAIILALFLGSAIVIAMRKYYAADRLHRKVKDLNNRLQSYRNSESDFSASYSVERINNVEHEYHGYLAVCRTSFQNGYIHRTLIKVFFDVDDDFNRREAEELVDKLNEK